MNPAIEGQGMPRREAGPRKGCRMTAQQTDQVERSSGGYVRQSQRDQTKPTNEKQPHDIVFRERKVFLYCSSVRCKGQETGGRGISLNGDGLVWNLFWKTRTITERF